MSSRLLWDPEAIISGSIFSPADRATLSAHSRNFTCAGGIAYDGNFTFCAFRKSAIYHHSSGLWTSGHSDLLAALEATPPPPCPAPGVTPLSFTPTWSREGFVNAVRRAQEYIAAGDIYQVNLTQQFLADTGQGSSADTLHHHFARYMSMRKGSPAPMAGFWHLPDQVILGFSPETFLEISSSGKAITRPIKGTRPRGQTPQLDQANLQELVSCPKERSELVMITDLLRNDIGQVCTTGSVRVSRLLAPESFAHVHHLVSTIEGQLAPGVSSVDAIAACFPGGSITGAPKKRAREIIAELEPVPRGLYTGALGWLDPDGSAHFNIVIRSLIIDTTSGSASCHVGAGIVADSNPESEYEETLVKFRGIGR